MSNTFAIVLAAGLGTRMKSKTHKVLHEVCGKPMIRHVTDSLKSSGMERVIVVVGALSEQLQKELGEEVEYVNQAEQLGTGHAVMQARHLLAGVDGITLIGYGDIPLVTAETYRLLVERHRESGAAATLLTANMENPFGYGRIIRDSSGEITHIVEEKDASQQQKQIQEVNSGIYCFTNSALLQALDQIDNQNAQGEYYLTDAIGIVKKMELPVSSLQVSDPNEVLGVNDRIQLAQLNRLMREKINLQHMRNGVTFLDPQSAYVDASVTIGPDTVIGPNVSVQGLTSIGEGCVLGMGTQIRSCTLGNQVTVMSSVLVESEFKDHVAIGPFAYIRPGCTIEPGVKIGDFVELKNSTVGSGSKIPHLAYVGDADIGQSTNIGCGVITVNYNGIIKSRTKVGDNSFIGSNSNLVAPITVGNGAYVATGSTVTDDLPDDAFAIARERQVTKENYASKLLDRLKDQKVQK